MQSEKYSDQIRIFNFSFVRTRFKSPWLQQVSRECARRLKRARAPA